jgi:hypothetical protein
MQNTASLYETDFYAWTEEQEKLIKQKNLHDLDLVHLQEELHLMGATEKRELSHRLEILLMHLLKWKYQSSRQCKSWMRTIKVQRLDIASHLRNNPSLRAKVDEYIADAYEKAVLFAADETNLDEDAFPNICEWNSTQILDNAFLPN